MSPLRWTCKSTYKLADALKAKGFDVGPTTVRELLHEMGYSLQGTSKQKEGAQHVDRDAQFHHISDTAAAFVANREGRCFFSFQATRIGRMQDPRFGGPSLRRG